MPILPKITPKIHDNDNQLLGVEKRTVLWTTVNANVGDLEIACQMASSMVLVPRTLISWRPSRVGTEHVQQRSNISENFGQRFLQPNLHPSPPQNTNIAGLSISLKQSLSFLSKSFIESSFDFYIHQLNSLL